MTNFPYQWCIAGVLHVLKPSYDKASLARELSLLLIGLLLKSCALVLVDECDEHLKIIIIIIITLFTSKSYQAKLKHFRLYSHKTKSSQTK